ncbi:MAG: LysR family transcriptional regulator [Myxococcales bacterium]|nr:LysR family transcriptional regulator [Polyangiaceae bacterium]MDW8249361.1 LysR family transcriptional regulator [Myxococcales bacterium]
MPALHGPLDWDDLKHMLAIHRHGTLARAGAVLRMAPTTVGRRLAALEQRAKVKLFERSPEGWIATTEGSTWSNELSAWRRRYSLPSWS